MGLYKKNNSKGQMEGHEMKPCVVCECKPAKNGEKIKIFFYKNRLNAFIWHKDASKQTKKQLEIFLDFLNALKWQKCAKMGAREVTLPMRIKSILYP